MFFEFIIFIKYNIFKIENQKQMIIVKIDKNIEKALKTLKSKVIKTKQTQQLVANKEFEKKSVSRRNQIKKAKYIQQKKNND